MNDVGHDVLGLARILLGVAIAIGGYRFLRASLITIALVVGGNYLGTVMSVLVYEYAVDRSEYWVTFILGGVLCALVAGLHTKSGIWIAGFCAGTELANLVMGLFSYAGSDGLALVWMAMAGVVCAILTFVLKKPGLIVATSFVGASMLITGIYYFAAKSIIESTEDYYNMVDSLRTAWWVLFAVCMAFSAMGIFVQAWYTAKGIEHEAQQLLVEVNADAGALVYDSVHTPHEAKALDHV